jgi:hypothetical protein
MVSETRPIVLANGHTADLLARESQALLARA